MKKILLSLFLALTAFNGAIGIAHADLLTYYNFNDDQTNLTAAQVRTALFQSDGGMQSTTITSTFLASNTTNLSGTTVNAANMDPAGQSLVFQTGTNNASNGNYFQFTVNTTGYENTMLSFATQKGSTGFNNNLFSYSTDGTTFTNFNPTGAYDPPTSFDKQIFDLSTLDNTDNQTSLTLRLTLNGSTGSGTAPNNRFDNIQVNANRIMATPEPETWAMMALGVGALAMFSWKRKKSAEEASFGGGLAI